MQEAHRFFDVPLMERWDLIPLETGLTAVTCFDQENAAEMMFWELGAQVIRSSRWDSGTFTFGKPPFGTQPSFREKPKPHVLSSTAPDELPASSQH